MMIANMANMYYALPNFSATIGKRKATRAAHNEFKVIAIPTIFGQTI